MLPSFGGELGFPYNIDIIYFLCYNPYRICLFFIIAV
ncbi:hypothetical protein [Pseudomonas phage PhL_UNISO_PA-DSM_ph0034]|uniref:Uncharacterized protein n=1 Tax=Pseudomonas phage PhL_UNISO_PA-DSM_ph0034 TaxID=2812900 RepID=A0A9E6U418_9CAUD|nr:hypothetical protein QE329_gp100 [Pseudomonas phage PhL_UNISO_PA-DSM_ph0034]QYC95220.1 hypothetical protein [Pseudomonas phage PhL_UNISO_PA-DSM_ph0034]